MMHGHFKRVLRYFKRLDRYFKRVDGYFKRVDGYFKRVGYPGSREWGVCTHDADYIVVKILSIVLY
jgi:hypothetical protein